ncbi:hypothetical protein IV203_023945 [Nitzschia inconspicua]|uniref:Uncharacterized protein n=1 Tax=Nitzschia inconspicua TaxID=303405 RepID=A0A9K3KBB2_9STRA|nr:hypothetical protein IV203_023945 [Nitzschia inconspicua]
MVPRGKGGQFTKNDFHQIPSLVLRLKLLRSCHQLKKSISNHKHRNSLQKKLEEAAEHSPRLEAEPTGAAGVNPFEMPWTFEKSIVPTKRTPNSSSEDPNVGRKGHSPPYLHVSTPSSHQKNGRGDILAKPTL